MDRTRQRSPISSRRRDGETKAQPSGERAKPETGHGNQQRLHALGIRAKLTVSQPADPEEREADRLADAFVAGGPKASEPAAARDHAIHRKCAGCEEDEGTIARKANPGAPRPSAAPSAIEKGSGAALPGASRARLENFFGTDLGGVRLHTDNRAQAQAAALNARAFAQGQDVWFGRGASPDDERLLAHEVAHVVQEGGDPARVQREFEMCEDPAEIAKDLAPSLGFGPTADAPDGPELDTVQISADEFQRATGVDSTTLPEGAFVGMDRVEAMVPGAESTLDRLAEGALTAVAPASAMAPTAMTMVPANSIGILWGAGHQTIFANVEGSLTMRGYRAHLFWHTGETVLPGSAGKWFTEQLLRGKPGMFRGDLPFLLTGNQSVIFLETDPFTAREFATELKGKQYAGDYRYSPPSPEAKPGSTEAKMHERIYQSRGAPRAIMCANNCITVPLAEIETVLKTHPKVNTPRGMLDLATGRYADGTYSPHEHGRARLMSEYMKKPDLSESPGAKSLTTTKWGGRALGAIRVGGTIMLVVGVYRTGSRLKEAYGTDDFPLVVADEAFTWTGAILGAAAGTAAASALICAPAGPVTFVCAAGGFLAGLLVGTAGAMIGSLVIPLVVRFVEALAQLGQFMLDTLEGLETLAKAGRGLTTHLFGVGPMAARFSISPCNWEWIALPDRTRGDINLMGFLIWSVVGRGDINHFLGNVSKPIGSYAVPPEMLQRIARSITALLSLRSGAAHVVSAEQIAKMTPVDFSRFLHAQDILRYRYDPYNLAELMFAE